MVQKYVLSPHFSSPNYVWTTQWTCILLLGHLKLVGAGVPAPTGELFIKIKSFVPELLGWVCLGEAVAAKEHHGEGNEEHHGCSPDEEQGGECDSLGKLL